MTSILCCIPHPVLCVAGIHTRSPKTAFDAWMIAVYGEEVQDLTEFEAVGVLDTG